MLVANLESGRLYNSNGVVYGWNFAKQAAVAINLREVFCGLKREVSGSILKLTLLLAKTGEITESTFYLNSSIPEFYEVGGQTQPLS